MDLLHMPTFSCSWQYLILMSLYISTKYHIAAHVHQSSTVHHVFCFCDIFYIFTQLHPWLHIENKVMYTSSYKSIGGNSRGGETGDGRHNGSHANNQTGESYRRKQIITLRTVLNSSRTSTLKAWSKKATSEETSGRSATLKSVMCHFVAISYNIKTSCRTV